MIREAAAEDAGRIAEIHVRSWQAAYDEILPPSQLASLSIEKRAEKFRSMFEKGERILLTEISDEITGWIAFGACRDEDRQDEGEIYAIYVHPDFWGQGMGSLLMREAEQRLHHFSSVSVWVLGKNERARRFYEHFGYKEDGVKKEEKIGEILLSEIRYEK